MWVFLAIALIPVYAPGYTVILASSIFMYLILTLSWTMFSGPSGYTSLAPAAFFGLGIYVCAIIGSNLPFPLIIVLTALISFIVALIVGSVTLRLKGIYFIVFTFGLVELCKYAMLFYEIHFTGTRGRFVTSIDQTSVFYYLFAIMVLLFITAYAIKHSRYGLALQSIGEEEEAAAHCGVNVTVIKILLFAISSIFMGAAGAVMSTKWTYIDPTIAFDANYSFMPVLMAIFGGMGSFFGPIIGSFVFTVLEEYLITKLPELYRLIFGAVLIISIVFLKDGLVGLTQDIFNKIFRRPVDDN